MIISSGSSPFQSSFLVKDPTSCHWTCHRVTDSGGVCFTYCVVGCTIDPGAVELVKALWTCRRLSSGLRSDRHTDSLPLWFSSQSRLVPQLRVGVVNRGADQRHACCPAGPWHQVQFLFIHSDLQWGACVTEPKRRPYLIREVSLYQEQIKVDITPMYSQGLCRAQSDFWKKMSMFYTKVFGFV